MQESGSAKDASVSGGEIRGHSSDDEVHEVVATPSDDDGV